MPVTITLSDATAAELRSLLGSAPSVPSSQPPVVTPPVIVVPPVVVPMAVAGRTKVITNAVWKKGTPSFYALSPLNDNNVWCICFTPTDKSTASISTAEYQGDHTNRNWALVRNHDGAIIADSGSRPVQDPGLPFNGVSSKLSPRVMLDVNEPYTFTIWNAVPGVSSRMVGQLTVG